MTVVRFHAIAEIELGDAVEFYESRHPGLGRALMAEVQRVCDLVSANPAVGKTLGEFVRRVVIRRFPYILIYRETSQDVYVLAIAHERRKPGYWQGR